MIVVVASLVSVIAPVADSVTFSEPAACVVMLPNCSIAAALIETVPFALSLARTVPAAAFVNVPAVVIVISSAAIEESEWDRWLTEFCRSIERSVRSFGGDGWR